MGLLGCKINMKTSSFRLFAVAILVSAATGSSLANQSNVASPLNLDLELDPAALDLDLNPDLTTGKTDQTVNALSALKTVAWILSALQSPSRLFKMLKNPQQLLQKIRAISSGLTRLMQKNEFVASLEDDEALGVAQELRKALNESRSDIAEFGQANATLNSIIEILSTERVPSTERRDRARNLANELRIFVSADPKTLLIATQLYNVLMPINIGKLGSVWMQFLQDHTGALVGAASIVVLGSALYWSALTPLFQALKNAATADSKHDAPSDPVAWKSHKEESALPEGIPIAEASEDASSFGKWIVFLFLLGGIGATAYATRKQLASQVAKSYRPLGQVIPSMFEPSDDPEMPSERSPLFALTNRQRFRSQRFQKKASHMV